MSRRGRVQVGKPPADCEVPSLPCPVRDTPTAASDGTLATPWLAQGRGSWAVDQPPG